MNENRKQRDNRTRSKAKLKPTMAKEEERLPNADVECSLISTSVVDGDCVSAPDATLASSMWL